MRIVLLGLLMIGIVSCNQTESIPYAVVSGTIINAKAKKLTVKLADQGDFNQVDTFIKEIPLAEDGTFSDTIYNPNDKYYWFADTERRVEVYLRDGDNIILNTDVDEFYESLTYLGIGSEVNNYIALNTLILTTVLGESILDEAEFIEKMKKDKELRIKQLNKVPETYSNFIRSAELDIEYEYLRMLHLYQSLHRAFTKDREFMVSEIFPVTSEPEPLEDFDYFNEEHFKISYKYRRLVLFYYSKLATLANEEGKHSTHTDAFFDIIENEIESEFVSNYFLERYTTRFNAGDFEASKELYDKIMKAATDSVLIAKLPSLFEKVTRLSKGSPSPKFVDYENHKGGVTSLDDFKGKYVYIDFWATWCGPCLAEGPSFDKVEKQYHGKIIVFIGISTDKVKDHDKWRKMVSDRNMGGIQLLADKGAYSEFYSEYGITSIPRFILIDPEGNIVSANAPRPSDPKLIELFDELGL